MIKSINSKELKAKLDANEDLILIDCREQDEWDAGHIAQAKFVPLSKFEQLHGDALPNKEAQIVMQCRSGKRSLNACQFLLGEDYENLTNLEDGIMGWVNNGFETVE
ncbi:rhodanese-like domain-containing protein [Halobacteriovorax sp. HLS]|uniref:rhodanese-like domain-containing protein n=1 Tax=Halobacteriovorax sp. HLS TaxID=2234000 RepID=UPI000FD89642|nr:rhodanese-like domain-containing protein [Halobacteriovorax sp. HLS]